ncbi:MAG: hypothetical protein JXK05_12195 [Campylobacterales bacterium]|nr:hypothetical protein [Campylobacterales bacterium]
MLLKILLLIAVLFTVYWLFFKKKPLSKHSNESSDEMIACAHCGTFVSTRDALLSGGRYYCSRECMEG